LKKEDYTVYILYENTKGHEHGLLDKNVLMEMKSFEAQIKNRTEWKEVCLA